MSRPLSSFEAVAKGAAARSPTPLMPDVASPAQEISRSFVPQSYFDSTLLEKALLAQPQNQSIVASTKKEEQISGYAIGLHPSSETPVAISFKVGGQRSSSSPIILKPGQIVRPHGQPEGGKVSGSFSGFTWGLPFGWLGGGVARLMVFSTPDAHAYWLGNPEVVFHRQRMKVLDPTGVSSVPFNWPIRFPWTQALQGSTPVPQKGQPGVVIEPTRVLLRLRATALSGPATMRLLIRNTQTFDLDSSGSTTGDTSFIDVTWPQFTATTGALGAAAFPVIEAPSELIRIGADDGGIQAVDLSGGSLANAYVDVVRFGRL